MAINRGGFEGFFDAMLAPIAATSDRQTVTSSSVQFDTTMTVKQLFIYTCDTDSYIKQGANPTASAADGSMFVPAGLPIVIDGFQGAKLATIRKSADGVATLQQMSGVV